MGRFLRSTGVAAVIGVEAEGPPSFAIIGTVAPLPFAAESVAPSSLLQAAKTDVATTNSVSMAVVLNLAGKLIPRAPLVGLPAPASASPGRRREYSGRKAD